jgi:hypothetical protein
MLNFVVVEDGKISNLIVSQSKEVAEEITGAECIQYDNTLVNPKIGQSIVDGEVVDLEYFPVEEVEETQDESELNDVDETIPTEDGES